MPVNSSITRWLIVAFAIETFCVTWGLKIPGLTGIFSVLYFITGICISFLMIRLPALQLTSIKGSPFNKTHNYYHIVSILLLAILMYYQGRYWMQTVPI